MKPVYSIALFIGTDVALGFYNFSYNYVEEGMEEFNRRGFGFGLKYIGICIMRVTMVEGVNYAS